MLILSTVWFLVLQVVCGCQSCNPVRDVKIEMPSLQTCQQISAHAGYNAQCELISR
jgi:hypothetical protein